MATDYYPDTENTAASAPAAPDTSAADTEQNPESDTEDLGETALVPKSILAGKELQPGDTVTFKVVHLYDDEVELRPASESNEEEEETEDMSASEEIDAMAQMPGRKGMV